MGWDIWLIHPRDKDKPYEEQEFLHECNHTHNCNEMVRQAGIPDWPYKFLDRVQEEGTARDMIGPIADVVRELIVNAPEYEAMNPENGWGSRESLLRTLSNLGAACAMHPDAKVRHWS